MSGNNKTIVIIGFVWPEPGSSAAGRRMMQLITFFKEHEWDVTFASTARKNSYTPNLNELGVHCSSINVNDEGFDHFINEQKPDFVLFDRFMTEEQFGWRVHVNCPEAVRILDTEDLHLLRYAREKNFRDRENRIEKHLLSDVAKREIASIYRCDLSLVISESEMHLLEQFYKISPDLLLYLPYMIDTPTAEDVKSWPDFSDRKGFMTIGNFRHKPNLDSIKYLRNDIWPLIRKSQPDVSMNIYGAYPTQQVKEWHDTNSGFLIHGRVDDSDSVMRQARVCLAPLRFGAGLKGKLIEAMLNGTPSITTSMGAEGIHASLNWPGVIADNPVEFAKAAVEIYSDENAWKRAQKHGITIIQERFSKSKFSRVLLKRLLNIENELILHRQHNFTGAMLMHHSMASTRFMSRWIEEKNRKMGS